MNSPDDREQEILRQERELQERELALRLREMEAEIYEREKKEQATPAEQLPLYQTRKHNPPENFFRRWGRRLVIGAKFCAIVIAAIVMLKIAYWLSVMIMVGGIGWITYQVLLDRERSKQ